jgi:hypothetical protein
MEMPGERRAAWSADAEAREYWEPMATAAWEARTFQEQPEPSEHRPFPAAEAGAVPTKSDRDAAEARAWPESTSLSKGARMALEKELEMVLESRAQPATLVGPEEARALPASAERAAWESTAEPSAAQEDAEEQGRRAESASPAEQSFVPSVLTEGVATEEPDEPEAQELLRRASIPVRPSRLLASRLLESRPSPEVSKQALSARPAREHAQPQGRPIAKQYESRARRQSRVHRARAGVPRGRHRRRASWNASFCRRCQARPTSRVSRWALLRARGPAH